jgi:predicted phage terminase large subunit-like protein
LQIKPQAGPQTAFLSSSADIVIYGGGAGGGKTWAILMEALRHIKNPRFNATYFRRTYPQIKNPGGLWDASMELWPYVGAEARPSAMKWLFPAGGYAVMRPLKNESNVLDWQGTELVYVAMDELTHFTPYMFWYLASRLRSTSGIAPYLRATCNPDPDSFVRVLIDWWIDEDGFPDPDRSGILRHFVRIDDALQWYDEPQLDDFGRRISKSLTFLPSTVYDNPALLQKDPNYLANLKSLPKVERDRLLGGNWNVKAVSGKVFRSDWLPVVDSLDAVEWRPDTLSRTAGVQWCRFWDLAATERAVKGKDPDWTVGAKLGLYPSGKVICADVFRDRLGPDQVERAIVATASQDGVSCAVRWFTDPGQAGVYQTQRLRSLLRGLDAKGHTSKMDKLTRAKPLSRAAEFGEFFLLRAPWNQEFINELIQFPDGAHDDQVDAASGAYQVLTGEGVASFGQSKFRG